MSQTNSKKTISTSAQSDKKFKHRLKTYLAEYSTTTGIQGLRYLSEERSTFEKFFWLICILVSLSMCSFLFATILDKYFQSPLVLSFAAQETPIFTIPFPSVTICLEPKCYSSKKFNYTYVNSVVQFPEIGTISREENYIFSNLALLCNEVDSTYTVMDNGNFLVNEDFYRIAHEFKPPNFHLVKCRHAAMDYNCSDIFSPVILDQGICFTYNSLNKVELFKTDVIIPDIEYYNLTVRKNFFSEFGYVDEAGVDTFPARALLSGAHNALEISIVYNNSYSDLTCTKHFDGFRVLLQSPLDLPRLSQTYFRLSNAKAVSVAIEPDLGVTSGTVRKYDVEKRQCYFRSERPLKYFKFYTQDNCLLECLTNYTLNTCGCVSFYMPRNNGTKICGINSASCVKFSEYVPTTMEVANRVLGKTTGCDCKPSCTELNYRTEISYSEYKPEVKTGLISMSNCEPFGCPTAKLSIYFKKDKFKVIERNELYGISDLVSNFGGLLGLFMGFSLMSIIEFIYFFTIRIFFNKKLYNSWSGVSN